MRKLLYLAALTMAAVAVAAAPAPAQVVGGNPPDYVFEEDGVFGEDGPSVVIDGDIVTDCPTFASTLEEQGYESTTDPELARSVLEQCEEAGLLDSGGTGPSASASASAAPNELGEPNDLDCVDLGVGSAITDAQAVRAVQAQAQETYDADPSDPNDLDADNDGIPCESTTSVTTGGTDFEDATSFIIYTETATGTGTASPVAEEAPVATTPEPADEPAAAATALPETGGSAPLLLPAAGLLLAAGLVGLRAARRRS